MITSYEERRTEEGWYAFQEKDGKYFRTSENVYPTRGDLVTAMAFGKHTWNKWERYGTD